MQVQVMTPEKTYFSGEASNLVLNAEKGQLTILEQHADLITLVRPGPLEIKTAQGTTKFELTEGVLKIEGPKCSVLCTTIKAA